FGLVIDEATDNAFPFAHVQSLNDKAGNRPRATDDGAHAHGIAAMPAPRTTIARRFAAAAKTMRHFNPAHAGLPAYGPRHSLFQPRHEPEQRYRQSASGD